MAKGVSVDSAAVEGGIRCCQTSIRDFETTAKKLVHAYRMAGSGGWKDQKYAELGRIVQDCCMAMKKPREELLDCLEKLEELLRAVRRYESTDL